MPSSLSSTPWLSTYTFDTSENTISEYPPITHGFRYSLTNDLCGVMPQMMIAAPTMFVVVIASPNTKCASSSPNTTPVPLNM